MEALNLLRISRALLQSQGKIKELQKGSAGELGGREQPVPALFLHLPFSLDVNLAPQTLQTSPPRAELAQFGCPSPAGAVGFAKTSPARPKKGSSGKGRGTQSQFRWSQSPEQRNQLGAIFKSGLSNFIYFRFLKLSVSRKAGNVHMTHPGAVTPLWAHGRGWETAGKNSIPIKIYQFPKQDDLGFTFYSHFTTFFFFFSSWN